MPRYIADQNKVLGIYESGTYAVPMTGSSFWFGQVTEHSLDEAENVLINRFLGTSDRNIDKMDDGPRDVTGTLTYNPQDMRLVFYAIGSFIDASGAGGVSSEHYVTEINSNVQQSAFTSGTGALNAPVSFTIEDSKQAAGTGRNFVRTVKGVVPNVVTITAIQGEKVQITVDYIAENVLESSGATTAVTEDTTRPFLWSDATVTLGGIGANVGSVMNTAKEVSLEINQNRTGPHYLNGSRVIGVPFNGMRDYTLSVTMDLDADDADMLYNEFFKAGSEFHAEFDLNGDVIATGSKHATLYMSGCRITSMENPSTVEGTTESTIEIRPTSLTGSAWETGTESGLYAPY